MTVGTVHSRTTAAEPLLISFDQRHETPLPPKRVRNVSESNLTSFTADETEGDLSVGDSSTSSFGDSDEDMVVPMEPTVIAGPSLITAETVDGSLKIVNEIKPHTSNEPVVEEIPTEFNSSEDDEPHLIELEPPMEEADTASSSDILEVRPLVVTSSRRRSIMKRFDPDEIPVKENKSSWKQLPKPDLKVIRATSAPAVLVKDGLPREKRSVKFHEVQTRAHRQTISDNPSVSYGPPIGLDWEYEELPPMSLESYELDRGPRRNMRQMMMNYYMRRNLLMWSCGFSEEDLKAAEKKANKVKRARSLTRTLLPAQKLEEAMQSVARKTKRFGKRGSAPSEVPKFAVSPDVTSHVPQVTRRVPQVGGPQEVPSSLPGNSGLPEVPSRVPEVTRRVPQVGGPPEALLRLPEAHRHSDSADDVSV